MTKMAKVKIPPEGKIYDSDGFWLRAAAVCVRDDSESEVLLVSSSGHSERWIIPGGKVQPNECPEKSAMREAMEEGGVVGKLGRYLGVFENVDRRHRTRVYVLTVSHLLDDFEDKDRRQRQWFSIEEAQRILVPHKPNHLRYLAALRSTRMTGSAVEDAQDPPGCVTSNGVTDSFVTSLASPASTNGSVTCHETFAPATNGVVTSLVCDPNMLPDENKSCSCYLVS